MAQSVIESVEQPMDPLKLAFRHSGGELERVNSAAELSEIIKKFAQVFVERVVPRQHVNRGRMGINRRIEAGIRLGPWTSCNLDVCDSSH